ncbi:MAG: hypothetical protein CVT68_00085 [Actinobacteria bacterium HGW-Actinobacteria-8]|nr:MAG: hypothetical protein CVT68_00085 [Actinobacteria bacterium HGW-Actinobacteria-8]
MTEFTPEPEDPMVYPYRSPAERALQLPPSATEPGESGPTLDGHPLDADAAPADASRADSSDG